MRLPEVVQLTGVRRSTIYRWLGPGDFPQRISHGIKTIAWLETEFASQEANKTAFLGKRESCFFLEKHSIYAAAPISRFFVSAALLSR